MSNPGGLDEASKLRTSYLDNSESQPSLLILDLKVKLLKKETYSIRWHK